MDLGSKMTKYTHTRTHAHTHTKELKDYSTLTLHENATLFMCSFYFCPLVGVVHVHV